MPIPVGPCIDGIFLPDHPAVLLKHGRYNKVDMISGNTKDDGNGVGTGILVTSLYYIHIVQRS